MVKPTPSKPITLTPLDEQILAHIRRFHMTTLEVVQKLFYADRDLHGVKTALHRLRDGGYLASSTLYQQHRYYRLTSQAAVKLYGEPTSFARPLGEQAIPKRYGVLAFCCAGPLVRHKLSSEDFDNAFPELVALGLPSQDYYRDADINAGTGETIHRLGYVLIDHGAHHRRIVRKCVTLVLRRRKLPAWRKIMMPEPNDRFSVAIVTAKEQKAEKIREGLNEANLGVKYRIEVVPELIHMT